MGEDLLLNNFVAFPLAVFATLLILIALSNSNSPLTLMALLLDSLEDLPCLNSLVPLPDFDNVVEEAVVASVMLVTSTVDVVVVWITSVKVAVGDAVSIGDGVGGAASTAGQNAAMADVYSPYLL
jgi:hypothetical protein